MTLGLASYLDGFPTDVPVGYEWGPGSAMAALGSEHSALLKKLGELSFRAVDPDIFGTPVPREAFDPAFDLAGVDVAGLIDAMLVKIGSESNPFLRTAEELAEIGFTGTPYRYQEDQ